MMNLFKDIISYLSHPQLVKIHQNIEKPGILLLRLTMICLLAGIVSGILGGMLTGFGLIPDPGPAVRDHYDVPQIMFFLGPLVLAPVTEEIIFRAQLRRLSGNILFIAFIVGTAISGFTHTKWAYLISPVVFIVFYLIYRFNIAESVTHKYKFWNRAFPWHFYFTAICFALIHLANFEKGIGLLPFGILYTLPQFAVGLVFGYARMNYGLKYAIVLHMMYNFLPALLLISRQ